MLALFRTNSFWKRMGKAVNIDSGCVRSLMCIFGTGRFSLMWHEPRIEMYILEHSKNICFEVDMACLSRQSVVIRLGTVALPSVFPGGRT